MSQALKRLALALFAASFCAHAAVAQTRPAETSTPPPGWVKVAPADEGFTVRMPKQPAPSEQRVRAGGVSAAGRRYASAADARTNFVVVKGLLYNLTEKAVNAARQIRFQPAQ
jgi:hypothetical protein